MVSRNIFSLRVQCLKSSQDHDFIFTKQKFQIRVVAKPLGRFLIFQVWVKI